MFCCSPDQASNSVQPKLRQQRLARRRRRQARQSLHLPDRRPAYPGLDGSRKLTDLDRRPTSPKRASRDAGFSRPTSRDRTHSSLDGAVPTTRDLVGTNLAAASGRDLVSNVGQVSRKPDTCGKKSAGHFQDRQTQDQRQTHDHRQNHGQRYTQDPRHIRDRRHLNDQGHSDNRSSRSQCSRGEDHYPSLTDLGFAGGVGRKDSLDSRPHTPASVESRQHANKTGTHDPRPHTDLKKGIYDQYPTSQTSLPPLAEHQAVHNFNQLHHARREGKARENPVYQMTCQPSSQPSLQHPQLQALTSRTSRPATPDTTYSYASVPPQGSQSSLPSDDPRGHWRPTAARKGSESGFSMTSLDQDGNYAVISYKRPRPAAYTNQNYDLLGQAGGTAAPVSPPAPLSLPASNVRDSSESFYSQLRPGSVPPHPGSSRENARQERRVRAGSVPPGLEPGTTAGDGTELRNQTTSHSCSSSTSGRSGSDHIHPRHGGSRRQGSRRHTVGAASKATEENPEETEKKREAFMQLLAQRYPKYADKIQGVEEDKPSRSRDPLRRRTSVGAYSQSSNYAEYDDLGTMSDLELPSFQRGGLARSSLPIVRSASTSLERPLGLVFLVYGDQTKKSVLPNEITTLDTVRALFVRAFPDLSMEMLEHPRRKIYLLDPTMNIYFQLEDLMDIKDRSVLKIHETDNDQPQRVRERPEVRGRTVQMPVSRSHSQQAYAEFPFGNETYGKTQSLPPQVACNYSDVRQEQASLWEYERRSRSRTPELAERPRSLSAGASSRQRFSHSPDRQSTPERLPLNPIPENRQLVPAFRDQANYYETVGPASHRGQYSSSIYDSSSFQNYPPSSPLPHQQTYIARSTRAPSSMAHPQRAVAPGQDPRDSPKRHHISNHPQVLAANLHQAVAHPAGSQHSQELGFQQAGTREGPEHSRSVTPTDDGTRNRIEKMEQQLANLAAWVHCHKDSVPTGEAELRSLSSATSDGPDILPASSTSSLSDGSSRLKSSGLSSRESLPHILHFGQHSAHSDISSSLAKLKTELHVLRRQQQLNMEAMRDEFMSASAKIKTVFMSIPEVENQMNFHKRNQATVARKHYMSEKVKVEQELSDLEASVEELRTDVISRQCRVNTCDVEAMALLLSNITKSLADLKGHFPELQNIMKVVMDAELRLIVGEEKFLKEEPSQIEYSLKRCKKITGTLYTLKRLASVQDQRPPHVPNMQPTLDSSLSEQKKVLLDNIRALVPDHEQRVKEMEAADASRERKKKINSQQEALKFGKSLEIATKNLRPLSASENKGCNGGSDEKDNDFDQNSNSETISVSRQPTNTMKPMFSTSKTPDKPTATVSAMTAGVADTITMMASAATDKSTSSVALTQTTSCLTTSSLARCEPATHSVPVGTESQLKKDATVYACQVSNSCYPSFPTATAVECVYGTLAQPSGYLDKTDHDFYYGPVNSSPTQKMDSMKPDWISDSGQSLPALSKHPYQQLPAHGVGVGMGVDPESLRRAPHTSYQSPPNSPATPSHNRLSTGLEFGPSLAHHSNTVASSAHPPTANIATSSELFITPPPPAQFLTSDSRASTPHNSPAHIFHQESNTQLLSHELPSLSSWEPSNKHKKVPPPPPPRKDSRPTSANISPVSSSPPDVTQHCRDIPHFVGGILSQHRLSGGPLFSTPKPSLPPKPVAAPSELDMAAALSANITGGMVAYTNKVHSAKQASPSSHAATGQKMVSRTQSSDKMSVPPASSVTVALDRHERGSSSESSSSSSSGASMGSQQSVVSLVKSPSSPEKGVVSLLRSPGAEKSNNKPKPDPPRRQSSLLAKLTGSKDSKNSKSKSNGVQL